ncbi:MAG TPA: NADH-quinone oxidoreductase subunit NuoH [Armatimonadetes bacterium]|nr:NADH-quinone oxidoreductase subunit NuoH [Armatimonadota bacterium]
MGSWEWLWRIVLAPIVACLIILLILPLWIWLERRVCGRIQARLGPNRVGPAGLLQPVADVVKLMFKEDITPYGVDRVIYLLAPVITVVPSIAALAVVPFGNLMGGDVNIGLLWITALSALAVYGVVLGGWSSNNKWSLLGAVRAAAQMISYELGLSLGILAVVVGASAYAAVHGGHALSLRTVVLGQQGVGPLGWNIIWQLPAFLIYAIAAVAEANRAPFDLAEAEPELTAGYHTEYSSFRFAMFYMGEYIHISIISAVATCLFLGGWLSPFAGIPVLASLNVSGIPVLRELAPIFWFMLKLASLVFCFIWLRWTHPRFRWDQLMGMGWVVLLPAGLAWLTYVAVAQAVAGTLHGHIFSSTGWFRVFVLVLVVGVAVWYRRRPSKVEANA